MKRFVILGLISAMLLLAGCSGSGQQPAPSTGAGQSQQSGATGQQPAPSTGAGQSQQSGATGQQQSGESAADTFAGILGMKGSLQYRVAYDISSSAAGQQGSSQMTQYLKGSTKLRIDSAYEGMESRTYLVDNTYYSCNKQEGWSCMKIDVPPSDATNSMDEVAANKQDYQITADGTMQIAGVTANCFKIIGKNLEYSRSCHSPEGVPLYAMVKTSTPQGGTIETEMKATSYTTSVSDSDFALPAEPTDLSDLYGAGTSPGAGTEDICAACNYLEGEGRENCLASCAGN